MGSFVHLHLHSEYSLLDGACRISDIPKKAKAEGHDAVAVTDHGNLYGAVAFYNACKKEGVKPIIGCEVYVAPRTRFDKEGKKDSSGNHLVLLCENEEGYRNLIYIVSKSFTEGFYSKPRVDIDLLREHSRGLIALSACLAGYIPQAILAGNFDAAREYALKLDEIFGHGNFYLELQNHGLSEQQPVIGGIIDIHEATGIPLVATNDAHYIEKSDSFTQAILMCIQTASTITEGKPIGFETDEFYYKSTAEMETLFGEYDGAIENTVKIAERCNFDFEFDKLFLPTYKCDNGKTPRETLSELASRGLEEKIAKGHIDFSSAPRGEYEKRIEYELSVIDKMGFCEYYLVVCDYVGFAKKSGIPVGPGRGSGAGSLVAYLVGITDIDPLKYDLLFERFLNPERVSMPDFDVDFCYDRRDEVIKYVGERYGSDHVAQIITFGTMAARAAIRDVGRALGMSYADVDEVAKLVPRALNITLKDALATKAMKELYNSSPDVKKLMDIASALEGMPRHASTHAAGVVITDKPVYTYVPLSQNGDVTVTQFDMDTVAKLGLVKFDFLALRYLTIIANAEEMIHESEEDFDISKIPTDDSAAYKLISSGQTDGVFQLESGGMKQVLTQLRPQSIDDIIATIALYRPGPMDSIPRYIACRNGKIKVEYAHPALEKILCSTYGCIVYQEQVMQIFRELAGYSYGRADIVRRAMSKKKADVMEAERGDFVNGAVERGVERKKAEELFEDMASFASYAFNKSHAAAYGVIAYRTAYLKTHYAKEYFSALLTSVLGDFAKTAEYISECSKVGISVLPPDVNESKKNFTVSGGNIRFGLLALKNLGTPFVEAIVNERKTKPFTTFEDFITRMMKYGINKRQIEMLIKSGACDRLGVYRSRLLASYELLIEKLSERNRANIEGQLDMFSMYEDVSQSGFVYRDIPEYSMREKLLLEKESSGMYFSGHMLDDYKNAADAVRHTPISEIVGGSAEGENIVFADRTKVTIIGIITKITKKTTRGGDDMVFLTLEDRFGEIEVIVFPKTLAKVRGMIKNENAVSVVGNISVREDEPPKILLMAMSELSPDAIRRRLYLRLPSQSGELSETVMRLLGESPGSAEVIFRYTDTGHAAALKDTGASADAALISKLEATLGRENVILREEKI